MKDTNTQTNIPESSATNTTDYEVYVAMTTSDNLDCLQHLFCEHAQYVISHADELVTMATKITVAGEYLEDCLLLLIQVRMYNYNVLKTASAKF